MGPPVGAFSIALFLPASAPIHYPQLPLSAWLAFQSEWVIIPSTVWVGSVSPMFEAFVEFALSFCLVWLAFVASYSLYSWYNSPRRVNRRKLIETGY